MNAQTAAARSRLRQRLQAIRPAVAAENNPELHASFDRIVGQLHMAGVRQGSHASPTLRVNDAQTMAASENAEYFQRLSERRAELLGRQES